jgi:hypothetical protein
MQVMNQTLTVSLDFPGGLAGAPIHLLHRPALEPVHGGVPVASDLMGRCALVYMDDCLVHSPTLEPHLLDVEKALEIFRRRQLYAKSSNSEFCWQGLGFLGQRLSKHLMAFTLARCSRVGDADVLL